METENDAARPATSAEQARRYADFVAPTFVTLARRAIELADLQPGQSVLDLATGTGLAAFLAAERVGREGTVVGLDACAAMLAVARERAESVGCTSVRWQQGEAAQLTFADEAFDAVLCVQALMLLPRPDAALEEVRRVLVEGGRAVITIWGARGGNEWIEILEEALRRATPGARLPRAFGLAQPGNLEALLQAAGFDEIDVARVPDRMRLQGRDAFWEWARAPGATGAWGHALAALPPAVRERVRAAVAEVLAPRMRDGEVTVGREIVYARAVVPAGA